MRSRFPRSPFVAILLVLTVSTTGQTSANTVTPTKVKDDSRTITPNDLNPTECAAITVTNKLSGSGTFTGTAAADLLTGGAGIDTISGAGGDDCILGGAGNDSLNGGTGTDVCIGGPGTDTFNSSCETRIQ